MLIGDTLVGAGEDSALGNVRDLDVEPGAFNNAALAFSVDAANPDNKLVGIFVDGSLAKTVVPGDVQTELAGLLSGNHSLRIALNGAFDPWPDQHGDGLGSSAYLRWNRSTDASCAGYRVYKKTGAVYVLVAAISRTQIERKTSALLAGARVSVWGDFSGIDPVNATMTLSVSAGTWSATIGDQTATGDVVSGSSFQLPYGAQFQFLDDAAQYGSGSLAIAIGPANEYLTAPHLRFRIMMHPRRLLYSDCIENRVKVPFPHV